MNCPRCHSEFDNTDGVCPECGVRVLRNVSGVMKTSAVMIATRSERGFYHSVAEVPEPLRTRLLETTNSANSGIIIIADRAGKEQLSQVIARRETTPPPRDPVAGVPSTPQPDRLAPLAWAGFVLILVLAAILFAIFRIDWAGLPVHW
jgi:hypothetical protein